MATFAIVFVLNIQVLQPRIQFNLPLKVNLFILTLKPCHLTSYIFYLLQFYQIE